MVGVCSPLQLPVWGAGPRASYAYPAQRDRAAAAATHCSGSWRKQILSLERKQMGLEMKQGQEAEHREEQGCPQHRQRSPVSADGSGSELPSWLRHCPSFASSSSGTSLHARNTPAIQAWGDCNDGSAVFWMSTR